MSLPCPRALLLLFAFGWVIALPAQRPGGGGRPVSGRVYGKVIDAVSGKGAEFATVTLFAGSRDSVITGTMVRGNGDFLLEPVPGGRYRLQVSFLGYRTIEQTVEVTRDRSEVDLGNLRLEADAGVLQEATVVRERSPMQMLVDRRVFNVDKDLAARGGSGVDVMKNVPGLSVDLEGNVEMRGARPQILVDGRPSSLTLEQIPAEEIERVEVITNPSVIFDANTTGGIINVVLKKSTKPGYSGQVQAGVGTNDRYQAGANVNLREGRWGFNLSANYNDGTNVTDGLTLRTDLAQGAPAGTFEQRTDSRSGRRSFGGRFGADVQVSNRSVLSLSLGSRFHNMSGRESQTFENRASDGAVSTYGTQVNDTETRTRSLNGQLAFRHKTPRRARSGRWTSRTTAGTATAIRASTSGASSPMAARTPPRRASRTTWADRTTTSGPSSSTWWTR
ncbi:MAG: TonB-dependent receptor [Flavobacteriales bacterium]|nr:TonB-dependent receptor [Flavobacteriales bacterium]